MKTKLIKHIFAVFIMMMGFAMTGLSQPTVTATANVVGQVVLTKTADLNFGSILSNLTGGTVIVAIDNSSTPSGTATRVPGVLTTHGIFNIAKGANTSVILTYATAASLTGPALSAPMLMSDYSSRCNISSTDGTTGGETVIMGSPYTITDAGNITASSIYVHLGATVTAGASQMAGSYTNTITLTATYN